MNCSMSSYAQTGQSAELNKENVKAALAELKREQKRAVNTARCKAYYQAHKQEIDAKTKAHRQAHPKRRRIKNWRDRGVKLRPDETWDDVYKAHIMTIKCQSCEVDFNESVYITKRRLDHDHDEPNYIRGTICHSCNTQDKWRTRMTPNSIYQKYKSTTT